VTLAAALVAARFVHFAALLILFGATLLPLYAGLEGGAAERLRRWLRTAATISAGLGLVSGLAWYALTAASMAGTASAALDPEVLATVFRTMTFGPLWLARLTLILFALVFASLGSARLNGVAPSLAALALASLAGTGHAGLPGGAAGVAHMLADSAHLLAAGAWLGGLLALAALLARADADVGRLLLRFSGVGYAALATLVLSGAANAWFLVGSTERLIATAYGRLLLAKIALFLAMAGLAAANRFWITPRLAASPADARWLSRIRRHVWLEQGLGLLVVAIVSVLGILQAAVEG
jgi:putative copper resistance protein D